MVEVVAGPFQPDDVATRERMRIATGAETGLTSMVHAEHDGPITGLQYGENVAQPAKERVWTLADDGSEQAYYFEAKKWLSTLDPGSLGFEGSYNAALQSVGSASHMQDPWVGDLITDLTTAINARVLAGAHPGVPAGLMSWSVEFLTDNDLYPGTVTGRELEITTAPLFHQEFNRQGVLISTAGTAPFGALSVIAISRDASEVEGIDYADPPPFYSTNGSGGTPPNAWSSTTMEGRTVAGSPLATAGPELITSVGPTGTTTTTPIDDAWWDANVWTITRFGADLNHGIPLLLTPAWLVDPIAVDPYPDEEHHRGAFKATLYMNAVWTPPPYRIIYDLERITIPPRRIRQRGDGLTGGARGIKTGARTRQAGNRTIGGIL